MDYKVQKNSQNNDMASLVNDVFAILLKQAERKPTLRQESLL